MDLYEYADAISKRWGLVLGLSLLAMVVAAVINLLITPAYEATAILSVPKLNSSIPCASLVKSTEVEAKVINALRASLPYSEQVSDRDIREVKVAESQNMLRITARSDTGRKAALIANAWADYGVEQISEAQLSEQQQLVIAKQNVEQAEENLRAFETEHGFGVLGFGTAEEELQAKRDQLNDYQSQQDSIERSIEETKTFRETIKGGGADSSTRAISFFITNLLQKVSKESEDSELSLQLFLHLAQEFDKDSWELRQQLNRFNDQHEALQSFFRQDQDGQADNLMPKDLFPVEEDQGSFVIEKRMAAWNRLFRKDRADSGLLFTDSPLALAYLLDGVQEKVEVFKLNITCSQAESKEVSENHPSWANELQDVFNTVLTTPWSRTLQERVVRNYLHYQ